ncbi:MAG: 50S ribosomal protein L17 [Candidatus Omnitrophica bacterium]|nr:50S ribosomal protein L17 [Candidatus Omnitrophota bacterium]
MRHAKKRHQLNRFTSWRKATLTSLARNLLIHQRIKTTRSKAKAAQPLIERLIAIAKKGTLSGRRRAFSILCDHKLVKLLFDDISKRFENRSSGFTRIINLNRRRGDYAQLAILELTEIKKKERKTPKKVEEKKPEEKPEIKPHVPERPAEIKPKPTRTFLRGIKSIFKKERDSLKGKRD